MSNQPKIVAGVMSGTSADGINVALVEVAGSLDPFFSRQTDRARPLRSIRLLGQAEIPFPARVREAILAAMNAKHASVADLAQLNSRLGELYADAVLSTQQQFQIKVDLIGCHGQTLYHQGGGRNFLGRRITTTWQTGEAAIIAARVGVPVVSDFRPADMAAGGKGAPLVPFLDYIWFRDARIGRIVQNIGGIANLTAIPARAAADRVIAFDTGPGNMVIDAITHKLYGRPFDQDGRIAASGEVIDSVLARLMNGSYFQMKPPKTAGREEFGREFVTDFLRQCRGARNRDVVATATALTAQSIADAVKRFVLSKASNRHKTRKTLPLRSGQARSTPSRAGSPFQEMILSGGGTKNSTLVAMLAEKLAPLEIVVRFSDEFGLPSESKEALAFAVLAYETWNRRPSNVPSATGARRPAVLGKISYV